MRTYARDMVELRAKRRELEAVIRKDQPSLTPSEVRRLAKEYVMAAYHELRTRATTEPGYALGLPTSEEI